MIPEKTSVSGDSDSAESGLGWRQIAALAAVYVIWGSTYLAIRFAIETLPGFSMSGVRFLVAGSIMYLWARMRGAAQPQWVEWRAALIVGAFLLLGGNGAVVWAEQRLSSGLAALIVSCEPLWIVLLLWVTPGARRPGLATFSALLVGFLGVALLLVPAAGDGLAGGEAVHLPSALLVMFAAVSWAFGSLYSRRASLPASPALSTGMQMLAGGVLLTLLGGATGEWAEFEPAKVTWVSGLALLYLVIFGALVAFSCYTWLVRTTDPTLVATYAYVNPVVAVFLGWLLADETVSGRTVLAALLIIGAVIVVAWRDRQRTSDKTS